MGANIYLFVQRDRYIAIKQLALMRKLRDSAVILSGSGNRSQSDAGSVGLG